MFTSRVVRHDGWQRLVADSWDRGWRSLLVRRFIQNPVVDTVVPATDEQKITLLIRGDKRTAVHHASGWRHRHLHAGSLSMTAPGQSTRIRWTSTTPRPLEHLSLHLPPAVLSRTAHQLWDAEPRRARLPDAFDVDDPVLPRLVVTAFRAAMGGSSDLYADSLAELLAVHLLTHHARLGARPAQVRPDRRVRALDEHLREHVGDPVSLDDLAAVVGMSRFHVLRMFRAATGETPAVRLTRLRMERACRMLSRPEDSISAVAGMCGYADPAAFARAFRREVGCSPSAFRRSR